MFNDWGSEKWHGWSKILMFFLLGMEEERKRVMLMMAIELDDSCGRASSEMINPKLCHNDCQGFHFLFCPFKPSRWFLLTSGTKVNCAWSPRIWTTSHRFLPHSPLVCVALGFNPVFCSFTNSFLERKLRHLMRKDMLLSFVKVH